MASSLFMRYLSLIVLRKYLNERPAFISMQQSGMRMSALLSYAKKEAVFLDSFFSFTISFEGRGFKYMNSFVTTISIPNFCRKLGGFFLKFLKKILRRMEFLRKHNSMS